MAVDGFNYKLYSEMTEEQKKRADKQVFARFSTALSPFRDGAVFTFKAEGYNSSAKSDIPTVLLESADGTVCELWLTTLVKEGREYKTRATIINDAPINVAFVKELLKKSQPTNEDARIIFTNLVKGKKFRVVRKPYTGTRWDKFANAERPLDTSLVGFEFVD